jgi:hypothetical protein
MTRAARAAPGPPLVGLGDPGLLWHGLLESLAVIMVRSRQPRLPAIAELPARHPGITTAVASVYAECAAICLSRHHEPPTDLVLDANDRRVVECMWASPSDGMRRAHANADDATRDAAYGVAIAAIEVSLGLHALARAETRTGADYYVGAPTNTGLDLEDALRLEVSGVDAGGLEDIRRRLGEKLGQLARAGSDLPGVAAAVGFQVGHVMIRPLVG